MTTTIWSTERITAVHLLRSGRTPAQVAAHLGPVAGLGLSLSATLRPGRLARRAAALPRAAPAATASV
jgi:hypothetical protein